MVHIPLLIGAISIVISFIIDYAFGYLLIMFTTLLLALVYSLYVLIVSMPYNFPSLYIKLTGKTIDEDVLNNKKAVFSQIVFLVVVVMMFGLLGIAYPEVREFIYKRVLSTNR